MAEGNSRERREDLSFVDDAVKKEEDEGATLDPDYILHQREGIKQRRQGAFLMTDEELAKRRAQKAAAERRRKALMSEEELAEKRAKHAASQRKSLALMTDEERAKLRAQRVASNRRRRALMTEEELKQEVHGINPKYLDKYKGQTEPAMAEGNSRDRMEDSSLADDVKKEEDDEATSDYILAEEDVEDEDESKKKVYVRVKVNSTNRKGKNQRGSRSGRRQALVTDEKLAEKRARKAASERRRMALMTEEELAKKRAEKAAKERRRRELMSEEELAKKRAARAAAGRRRRELMTDEELAKKRAENAATKRRRIALMTDEELAKKRAENAATKRRRIALMTDEELAKKRAENAATKRRRIALMTDEELAEYRAKKAADSRRRRTLMTNEELAKKRAANAANKRKRRKALITNEAEDKPKTHSKRMYEPRRPKRTNETEAEKKAKRLEKYRQKYRKKVIKRMAETEAERNARVEKVRERMKQRLSEMTPEELEDRRLRRNEYMKQFLKSKPVTEEIRAKRRKYKKMRLERLKKEVNGISPMYLENKRRAKISKIMDATTGLSKQEAQRLLFATNPELFPPSMRRRLGLPEVEGGVLVVEPKEKIESRPIKKPGSPMVNKWKEVAENVFICEYCSREYKRRISLHMHVKQVHLCVRLNCDLCEKSFLTKVALWKHKVNHHKLDLDPAEAGVTGKRELCPYCGETFFRFMAGHLIKCHPDKVSAEEIMNAHKLDIKQRNCKRKHNADYLKGIGGGPSSQKPEQKSEDCAICDETFPTGQKLTWHILGDHYKEIQFNVDPDGNNLKCRFCEESQTEANLYRLHVTFEHSKDLLAFVDAQVINGNVKKVPKLVNSDTDNGSKNLEASSQSIQDIHGQKSYLPKRRRYQKVVLEEAKCSTQEVSASHPPESHDELPIHFPEDDVQADSLATTDCLNDDTPSPPAPKKNADLVNYRQRKPSEIEMIILGKYPEINWEFPKIKIRRVEATPIPVATRTQDKTVKENAIEGAKTVSAISRVTTEVSGKCELCGEEFKAASMLWRHKVNVHKLKSKSLQIPRKPIGNLQKSMAQDTKIPRGSEAVQETGETGPSSTTVLKTVEDDQNISACEVEYFEDDRAFSPEQFPEPVTPPEINQFNSQNETLPSSKEISTASTGIENKMGETTSAESNSVTIKGKDETHSKIIKCDICGEEFESVTMLWSHKVANHKFNSETTRKPTGVSQTQSNSKFVCEYCCKEYQFAAFLANHIKNVHIEKKHEMSTKCDICAKTFQSAISLWKHKVNFHKLNLDPSEAGVRETQELCPYCGDSVFRMTSHVKKNHADKLAEFQSLHRSNKMRNQREREKRHEKRKGKVLTKRQSAVIGKEQPCPYCGDVFYLGAGIKNHVWKMHPEKIESFLKTSSEATPTLIEPPEPNDGQTGLNRKWSDANPDLPRSNTSENVPTAVGPKYACPAEACKKLFVSFWGVYLHYVEVHSNPEVGEEKRKEELNSYTCDICGKWNPGYLSLYNHKLRAHRVKIRLMEYEKGERNYRLQCESYDKGFMAKTALEKHVKLVHDGILSSRMVNICDLCSKRFASRTNLWRHKVEVHKLNVEPSEVGVVRTKKAEICRYCEEVVFQNMNNHVRTRHPDEFENYSKSKGSSTVKKTKHSLSDKDRRREKRKLEERRSLADYNCEVCDKSFGWRKDKFDFHMRRFHPEEVIGEGLDTRVGCDMCGEKFWTDKQLALHLFAKHAINFNLDPDDDNNLSCHFCGKSQPEADVYKLHVIHAHSQDLIRFVRDEISNGEITPEGKQHDVKKTRKRRSTRMKKICQKKSQRKNLISRKPARQSRKDRDILKQYPEIDWKFPLLILERVDDDAEAIVKDEVKPKIEIGAKAEEGPVVFLEDSSNDTLQQNLEDADSNFWEDNLGEELIDFPGNEPDDENEVEILDATLSKTPKTHQQLLNQEEYECKLCREKFSNILNFQKHQSYHELGFGPFNCDECETSCKTQDDLRYHQMRKHPAKF